VNAVQLRNLADAARATEGAVVVETAGAVVIVLPRDAGATDPDEQLPEREAARFAGVSLRTLRDARRAGDLVMYGGQRSRTVRRGDLAAWIESRRVRPVEGPDDPDLDRRTARMARERAKGDK
jgi:hypothetical protein